MPSVGTGATVGCAANAIRQASPAGSWLLAKAYMSVYGRGSPRTAGRGEQAPDPLAGAAASADGAIGAAL
ncbi:hypothetical protein [Acidovorax sp. SUPP2539]|uniref:hypothetical protein n=1 Tax=Acidovorax sp. SUPP2539 TaxID=2920878 RepID=UPI0023DE63D2|nr:hypothetical protein [Acidovorax sp. SUPP2539]GKS87872.1 hypothetical protein AVTE2539_00925 [Acidovorax sp. SUPP2539]